MNTFLRYHAAMLTWHTGSIDEIFHFIVGDNHRRVKTCFFYNRFCLVGVVFYIGCCASICGTKNVPNLLTTWHTIQGHPCMGILRLMTLNFGGGAGGKSSTGGIFTASSGVSIRQCWRMLLKFFVHNLRISHFTNV